jgi:hypothetical protein
MDPTLIVLNCIMNTIARCFVALVAYVDPLNGENTAFTNYIAYILIIFPLQARLLLVYPKARMCCQPLT